MNTRIAARTLGAVLAVVAGALLAGARRSDPITCSVSSVTVVKFIPVESMNSEPATILRVEVEPHGPRTALFTQLPPMVTSVTDAGGKQVLLKPAKPVKLSTSRTGRPQSAREELIARVRSTVRPDPFQHISRPPEFQLAAFPSTIKELKGNVEVLTGEESRIPLEVAGENQPREVSPGVSFVITKITENKQVRFADFRLSIDKDHVHDGASPGLEPVVVGIVRRKGEKEVPLHMYDLLTEKEQADKYIIASPSPLMLTETDGTPCNWELRLIRNIKRSTVEFECSDIVVRPQH